MTLKQLFKTKAYEITTEEYDDIIYREEEGYLSMILDADLDALLEYLDHVTMADILEATYNGTLYFYTYKGDYIMVLES